MNRSVSRSVERNIVPKKAPLTDAPMQHTAMNDLFLNRPGRIKGFFARLTHFIKIGNKGKETVINHYSVEANKKLYLRAFNKLA